MVRVPHVFATTVTSGRAQLDPGDRHHLRRVLRLSPGDRVVVGDGAGSTWPGVLADGDEVELVGEAVEHPRPRPALHVLQALPKGRKLDEVVEALVELGVERVTPVQGDRSVVRLDGARRVRARQRWAAVARAAAAQSRRAWLPVIERVRDVPGAAEQVEGGVVAHVGAGTPLADALAGVDELGEAAVAVGPEGGWTDPEVERWIQAGLVPVTLGASVLRTEHAAFAAAAVVAYVTGRMSAPARDVVT